MKTLELLASDISGLYYQEYEKDDDFFQLEDFMVQVAAAYNKLVADEYSIQKLVNRQETGFSMVTLAADLLQEVVATVEKKDGVYIADLPWPVMIFPFDSMMTGVQAVRDKAARFGYFIKASVQDRWMYPSMPNVTRTFYSVEKDRIVFEKLAYPVKEVLINYAPSLDETCKTAQINDMRAKQITDMVLNTMLIAKNGVVIDKSNDNNNNVVAQTELAPEALNQLK